MRILFLDAYFYPEQTADIRLELDLLKKLVDEGNMIDVICPNPTRDVSESIIRKYRRKKREEIYGGKVQITRFWAPQEKKSSLLRALRYFWCNLRTFQIGIKRRECQIVYCNSTPPTQGWIAGKIAKRLTIPLVYSLQDIFPDSLVTTGLSRRGSLLWKIGRKIEDKTYEDCSKIIVITREMRENLLNKNVDKEKIKVISNWIDTDQIKPIKREENQLFDEFRIDRSKYIVLYAGNFGLSQGAEIILDVAEKLYERNEIQFVIFGGGSEYEAALERAKDMQNVFIHTLMPLNRISEVYSMGDVALITCKSDIGKNAMPSKIWSIMACNTPVIASFDLDSELCRMIEMKKAGICVEPENADAIVTAVMSMKNSRKEYSNNRSTVMHIASKETCTTLYLQAFIEALKMHKV